MNKIIYVKAHFKPIIEEKTIKIPTGEKKRGFFGGEKDVLKKEKRMVETGISDCEIDGERLSSDIQNEVDCLNREGYEIISIMSVISGKHNHETDYFSDTGSGEDGAGWGWGYGYGYGYGYSYTEGVTIIAREIT